jgi:uroporphyrinogen III methyltransferase / synthase
MVFSVGKVYFLGAGPGSRWFLTIAGEALLKTATVVIYDALIDPELLRLVSKNCLCLSVGKRGNQPSTSQSDINQLLVQFCQQGHSVVRLKSGDPAFFGRIAEEIKALQAAGCDYEVWPGLSSAIAAPALAGIPLTDAQFSQSVTIVSAHDLSTLDWLVLARTETLVVLMGGRLLPDIIEQLQHQGRPPTTPIAIIRWAGHPQQTVWQGTLETIVEITQGEALSPTVMVIGEVVKLRDTLNIPVLTTPPFSAMMANRSDWNAPMTENTSTHDQPLLGQTILVTRAATQSGQFSDRLQALGARVLEMAALEIVAPSSWQSLDEAIAQFHTFDWLILTSANGVEFFFTRLQALGKDARALSTVKVAVVGRKTAEALKQQGITPDFIPPNYIADALVEHFPGGPNLQGLNCLFPRVESGGREVLTTQLTVQGARVVEVAAYQSQCPKTVNPRVSQALQEQQIDIITFASSKTVEHFCQLLQQATQHPNDSLTGDWQVYLKSLKIASIGPQTSQSCQRLLGRVDLEAKEFTLDGLTQVLIDSKSL